MIISDWSNSFRKSVYCAMVLVVAPGDYNLISHPTVKRWQEAQGVCTITVYITLCMPYTYHTPSLLHVCAETDHQPAWWRGQYGVPSIVKVSLKLLELI